MKTFAVKGFNGHWPVGTSAVVVAEHEADARGLLADKLKEFGLTVGDAEFMEVDPDQNAVLILQDGDY